MEALETDHEFLIQRDVYTADILETWITCKRKHEIDPVKLRPHPYASLLYYDA